MAISCIISEKSETLVENRNFFIPLVHKTTLWGNQFGILCAVFHNQARYHNTQYSTKYVIVIIGYGKLL